MVHDRLIHDSAVAMSQAILDTLGPRLPYEERLKAIGNVYIICKGGIEAYLLQQDRMRKRLKPLDN